MKLSNKLYFAVIGFFVTGFNPIGAIVGFIIGALFDGGKVKVGTGGNTGYQTHSNQRTTDPFGSYSQFDFQTMILALSAYVMKADGTVKKSELEYVKKYLLLNFGENFTPERLQVLKKFIDQPNSIPLSHICTNLRIQTKFELRVQLLHFLHGIAKADGEVVQAERQALENLAKLLGVSNMNFGNTQKIVRQDSNNDYKVLGIDKSATDEEVKKAYRQLAIRYHPDKVARMGESHQKEANEKFQKINEAYDNIKKSRGIK